MNPYYDKAAIEAQVESGRHRDAIGGLWEEIGQIQFDFLRSRGLKPYHRILDIGCGCLRVGVKLVDYLDFGNYYGIDINQSFLDAGYDIELKRTNLDGKLPRNHLVCDGEFHFSAFAVLFHFALAQSLFTHLPANHIQLCLANLAASIEPNGTFLATFFIVPDNHDIGVPYTHRCGVQTHDHRDPYHYRTWQIQRLCDRLPWDVELIGDWSHPRDQQMVIFRRHPPEITTRALEITDGGSLSAGANHYRAFVGRPDLYDFLSSSQFALLFALGLREQHRVLRLWLRFAAAQTTLSTILAPGKVFWD